MTSTHHIYQSAVLEKHGVDSQLGPVDGAQHNGTGLKGPPLKGQHQKPWSTETHKLPPLGQALKAPPTPGLQVQLAALDVDHQEEWSQRDGEDH